MNALDLSEAAKDVLDEADALEEDELLSEDEISEKRSLVLKMLYKAEINLAIRGQ